MPRPTTTTSRRLPRADLVNGVRAGRGCCGTARFSGRAWPGSCRGLRRPLPSSAHDIVEYADDLTALERPRCGTGGGYCRPERGGSWSMPMTSAWTAACETTRDSSSTFPGQSYPLSARAADGLIPISRPRARIATCCANGNTSSGRSRSGGTGTTLSAKPASGAGMSSNRSAVTANGTEVDSAPRSTKLRRRSATHVGNMSTSRTITAVCALPSSGVHNPSHVWISVGAGALAHKMRSRGYVCRAACASSVARPEPASPTAATIEPATIACSARATAQFQASESACRVPDPGSSRGTSTRKT